MQFLTRNWRKRQACQWCVTQQQASCLPGLHIGACSVLCSCAGSTTQCQGAYLSKLHPLIARLTKLSNVPSVECPDSVEQPGTQITRSNTRDKLGKTQVPACVSNFRHMRVMPGHVRVSGLLVTVMSAFLNGRLSQQIGCIPITAKSAVLNCTTPTPQSSDPVEESLR